MNKYELSKHYQSLVDWDKAIELYSSGYSITEVGKRFGVTYDFMRTQFKKRGVVIRQGRHAHVKDKKYKHFNIFDPMTNEGAYLLGWIVADGNVSKDNQLRLWVAEEDKDHIDYLRSMVTTSPLKTEHRSKTGKDYYGFGFKNADITDTLRELGVHNRKSYNDVHIDWSKLNDEQMVYFILGLLEGDGHLAKDSNLCSIIMYDVMWERLGGFLAERGIYSHRTKKDDRWSMDSLSEVVFTGEDYFNLMTLLYTNTPSVKPLARKYNRFLDNCTRVQGARSKYRDIARTCLNAIKV